MGKTLQTAFTCLLIFYLILFILENLFAGFVSHNFDLNILLIPLFIFGVASALFPIPKQKHKPVSRFDYLIIVLLTILTFVIIFVKTSMLGQVSIVLSFMSSLLVLFVSLIVLLEK